MPLCFYVCPVHYQDKPFNITVIQVYALTSNAEEAEVEWFCEDLQDLLELTPQKDVLFFIGDWNAKVGSQETPGVTGKFGLGVQNDAGQRLIEFCQETYRSEQASSSNNIREDSTHGHHQVVNTEIWLYPLQPKMEKLYTVTKYKTQSWLAQIMNSLLPNSDIYWREWGKSLDHSGMT